ncbi:MAG: hypothetical protein M1818_000899 [Claussenomyces sp. TS43310]|nr:MAG: hypothetical protein M1818_000899 [Claussenomyces sp. TS43310]
MPQLNLTGSVTNRVAGNVRRMTKPPKQKPPNTTSALLRSGRERGRASRGSRSPSTELLSHVPYSGPSASNVFGIGSEHPFANYCKIDKNMAAAIITKVHTGTCQGGLSEVISVLPEKIQADILLERQTFFADYEHFWSLSHHERTSTDGAMVGLLFAMLAIGTQFVTSNSTKQTAEFYVSAAHQSLRMSSYLNKTSVRSIQTMVLITYFLINDNHASDGWAFAGILIRQAYAMGLHRDPNIMVPEASIFEKQQRRKLWQAVLLQDTFLTVLLALPPSATHTDVNVADLIDDTCSIASHHPNDTAYIRGCWRLANLVQEAICSPRSLDIPICTTARRKAQLLSEFKTIYRSFPDIFRSWDVNTITSLAHTNTRVVRQTLFLTSNYWHNVMLLHSTESLPDVTVNVRGTLEAAHEAISAFFILSRLFGNEAKVWWVFNHRAFLEALCIANVVRNHGEGREAGNASMDTAKDALFVRAKSDIGQSHYSLSSIF